jgi:hypothetical protein
MVIQVDAVLVFTVCEVQLTLADLDVGTHASLMLIVEPYHPDPSDQQTLLPQVDLDQLRIIHHVLHGLDLTDPVMLVTTDNAATVAGGQQHTHRACLQGPEHLKWIDNEYAQLNKNDS